MPSFFGDRAENQLDSLRYNNELTHSLNPMSVCLSVCLSVSGVDLGSERLLTYLAAATVGACYN